ncbi:hypothetical protein FB451DRAFT_1195725 [Mycena latifolia]|nr:hypothetical protein FB451DRAFT_1195725 [Mycena latifolia]
MSFHPPSTQLPGNCFWQLKHIALEHVPGVPDKLRKELGDCPEVYQIPLHITPQYPVPAMKKDESTLDGNIDGAMHPTCVTTDLPAPRDLGTKEYPDWASCLPEMDIVRPGRSTFQPSLGHRTTVHWGRTTVLSGRWLPRSPTLLTPPGIPENSPNGSSSQKSVHQFSFRYPPETIGPRFSPSSSHNARPKGGRGKVPITTLLGVMDLDNEKLEAHGLLMGDGDLLTHALKDKLESARRNSTTPIAGMRGSIGRWGLFHGQMAVDGFWIYCGHDNLEEWAKSVKFIEFEVVARTIFDKLFSTATLNKLRVLGVHDITLENVILFNRDALFYVEFGLAIKKVAEDNAPGTIPHELAHWTAQWLKPVDLLQEHQNFWAKIIYNTKGTNKSWKWLSMITVCIFTLRNAMRTVQTAFQIPAYGEKHKTPLIDAEVAAIAVALKDKKIELYVEDRLANDHVAPVRDLICEGTLYANDRKAFHRFTRDTRKLERRGFDRPEGGDENEGDDKEEEGDEEVKVEDYTPTEDDLRVDDKEFLMEPQDMLDTAIQLTDETVDSDMDDID